MDTRVAVSLAETYLAFISPDSPPHVVEAYVRLAAQYGVPVGRIAEVSGIPLNRVDLIVRDG